MILELHSEFLSGWVDYNVSDTLLNKYTVTQYVGISESMLLEGHIII